MEEEIHPFGSCIDAPKSMTTMTSEERRKKSHRLVRDGLNVVGRTVRVVRVMMRVVDRFESSFQLSNRCLQSDTCETC